MADRLACQQEFEKPASVWSCTDDPNSLAELNRRKVARAEESVQQRKKAAELEEVEALSCDNGCAGPSISSLDPLPELSVSRVNRLLLQAQANAERYKPKVPSGLWVVKNMSPT
jgi:hypothetical protein